MKGRAMRLDPPWPATNDPRTNHFDGLAKQACAILARYGPRELLARVCEQAGDAVRTQSLAGHIVADLVDTESPVIVDAGAYHGDDAATLAGLFEDPRIICVEPVPGCVEQLRSRFEDTDGIEIAPVVLGDSDDEVDFHVRDATNDSSLFPVDGGAAATISRPQRRLDSLVDGPVDILKMDVLGAEPDVLRGATETLAEVSVVVTELNYRPHRGYPRTVGEVDSLMREHGFELYALPSAFHDHHDRIEWGDAIYGRAEQYRERHKTGNRQASCSGGEDDA